MLPFDWPPKAACRRASRADQSNGPSFVFVSSFLL
jgi:hypothetical protein